MTALPGSPLSGDRDDLAQTLAGVTPVHLNGLLGVVRTTFLDRRDDHVMFVDGNANVRREHADVHADVALRLRLHRVVQREETRTGARFYNLAMELVVEVVEAAVIDRRSFDGYEELGVQRFLVV